MKRRAFVKGLVFSIPGIYLNPMTALCTGGSNQEQWLVTPEEAGSRPFIIFIGDYGRSVMGQYLKPQSAYPIARPCRHVRPDINLVSDFIYIDGYQDLALPKLDNSLLMIVLDGFIYEDRKLAAILATYYQQAKGNYIIAIVPNASIGSKTSLYSLVLNVRRIDYDTAARVIHSFYNTYCSCSGLGNLVCMKVHIDDFKSEKIRQGQVIKAVSFNSFKDPVYQNLKQESPSTVSNLVATTGQDTYLYAIIEMPVSIENPFKAWKKIMSDLSGGFEDDFDCLPHPSLPGNSFRLTLFRLS
jgi:hypothetical protein